LKSSVTTCHIPRDIPRKLGFSKSEIHKYSQIAPTEKTLSSSKNPEGLKTDTWENTRVLISRVVMSASLTAVCKRTVIEKFIYFILFYFIYKYIGHSLPINWNASNLA